MISDVEAWTLAIEMARASDPRHREQIDSMLAERGFEETGKFASYGCQFRTLQARPWATVPCSLLENVDVVLARGDDGMPGNDYTAAVLLKKCASPGSAIGIRTRSKRFAKRQRNRRLKRNPRGSLNRVG
jgi:hypothetical protein